MDTTGGATSAPTGDPSTGEPPEPTTGPTTETSETSGTSATSGTTGPEPECESDLDCSGYCEYCVDGECYDSVGCCGLWPAPDGTLELRCIGYECYEDISCNEGYYCDNDGDGGGFCQPLTPIPVCERQPLALSAIGLQGAPSAIALADLDGDGALDLIAVLPESAQVEVALGDGQGGFQAGTVFPTGLTAGAQRVAVADFDVDGSLDLALTSPAPVGELSLLFGQDAVFAAPVPETIGQAPQQVWAGDFDGDGRADLLTHDGGAVGSVTLRTGDGMGGFGPASSASDGNGLPFAAAVGEVTGDDRTDIVHTSTGSPGAWVLQYEMGAFAPVVTVDGPGATLHDAIAVGDVDGDGVDDIVGHRAPGGVALIQVWPMTPFPVVPEFAVDGEVQFGPMGDIDGDGRGDLVTAGTEPTTVRVIYLDAPCVQSYPLPTATAPPLLARGDLDGDGKIDVVAGAIEGASASVLRSGP